MFGDSVPLGVNLTALINPGAQFSGMCHFAGPGFDKKDCSNGFKEKGKEVSDRLGNICYIVYYRVSLAGSLSLA